ncbi:MAG TPA: hypothetical protein DCP68_01195 [Ruminococcus sp.]|nr:hypothetical protein [Ruminococcus sp.]
MKNKLTITLILLAAVNLILSVIYIIRLPETVPTHFDAHGICDGMGSKGGYLILGFLPLLFAAIVPLGMKFAKNAERNRKVIAVTASALCVFFIAFNWFMLTVVAGSGAQIGDALPPAFAWPLLIGMTALFTVLGNYIPLAQPNRTIGIRLPWTLNNDTCWKLTHRFTGRLLVFGGTVTLAAVTVMMLLKAPAIAGIITVTVFISAVTVGSSVYAYQHRNG